MIQVSVLNMVLPHLCSKLRGQQCEFMGWAITHYVFRELERQKSNKDSLIETSDERSTKRQSNKETSSIQTIRKKMDEKENKN